VAFGMGGGLLQKLDRDTQKFAFKCSSVVTNGKQEDVYKNPISDRGKISKKGRMSLVDVDGELRTVSGSDHPKDIMIPVFENGKSLWSYGLADIRERAAIK